MLQNSSTDVVIQAITLRGIGSYLTGARLELKPLTILCGTNGSGKSTWLKALTLLSNSLLANRIPFGFNIEDRNENDLQIINAFYHTEKPSSFEHFGNEEDEKRFGPPGTIGLELLLEPTQIHSSPRPLKSVAKGFFEGEEDSIPHRVKLRIAHPTHASDQLETPELRHLIELTLDDHHCLRLESERDPFQKFDGNKTFPSRTKPYRFYASGSFFDGNDQKTKVVAIGSIPNLCDPKSFVSSSGLYAENGGQYLFRFVALFEKLMRKALDGYFHVGAIRKPYLELESSVESLSNLTRPRFVGDSGEHAWRVEFDFAERKMLAIERPSFIAEEINARWIELAFNVLFKSPNEHSTPPMDVPKKISAPIIPEGSIPGSPRTSLKMAWVFTKMPASARERLEESRTKFQGEYEEDDAYHWLIEGKAVYANALNSLLDDPDLFLEPVWGVESVHVDSDNFAESCYEFTSEQIASLVRSRSEKLSPQELRQLNYLLILDAFAECAGEDIPMSHSCKFHEYLSHWLDWLLSIELTSTQSKPSNAFHDHYAGTKLSRPTPFLLDSKIPNAMYNENPHPTESANRNQGLVMRKGKPYLGLARVFHPCFGSRERTQPPRQLSAAFHQIFPILVQLGAMKKGELFGVENPEVHLHPNLQIKMLESLIEHAKSGRRVIVETHSDLVIRRVLRAILEEELSQSQVEIYFTDFLQHHSNIAKHRAFWSYWSSSLSKIQFDEQGHINNWPKGFLDEDALEAGRLIEIMYGKRRVETPEEGYDE